MLPGESDESVVDDPMHVRVALVVPVAAFDSYLLQPIKPLGAAANSKRESASVACYSKWRNERSEFATFASAARW